MHLEQDHDFACFLVLLIIVLLTWQSVSPTEQGEKGQNTHLGCEPERSEGFLEVDCQRGKVEEHLQDR